MENDCIGYRLAFWGDEEILIDCGSACITL